MLFDRHRDRLKRMVHLRMDGRVRQRVDVSDVLQDAYLDLASQLPNYAKDPKLPFFLWLRRITGQRLAKLHRFHLGRKKRDVARDKPIQQAATPEASSVFMAKELIGQMTSPSGQAVKRESKQQVESAIEAMPDKYREIIALRHIEQLSNSEAAVVLDITTQAASKRYARALRQLRSMLVDVPGLLG